MDFNPELQDANEELEQICKETLEKMQQRTSGTGATVDDPWANRSEQMRCRTCMWFVVKSTGDHRGSLGRCRRRAPTMDGYPVVFEVDWCGDHKLDEAKVG